jgi:hypothetical protein
MNDRELAYDMRLEKDLDYLRTQERMAAAQRDRATSAMDRIIDENPGLASILDAKYNSASKSSAVS